MVSEDRCHSIGTVLDNTSYIKINIEIKKTNIEIKIKITIEIKK